MRCREKYNEYMRLYMRQYFIDKPWKKRSLVTGWHYTKKLGWRKDSDTSISTLPT